MCMKREAISCSCSWDQGIINCLDVKKTDLENQGTEHYDYMLTEVIKERKELDVLIM